MIESNEVKELVLLKVTAGKNILFFTIGVLIMGLKFKILTVTVVMMLCLNISDVTIPLLKELLIVVFFINLQI